MQAFELHCLHLYTRVQEPLAFFGHGIGHQFAPQVSTGCVWSISAKFVGSASNLSVSHVHVNLDPLGSLAADMRSAVDGSIR